MSRRGGRSLQRTLAVRFALTMMAGLLGLGALAYAGVRGVLAGEMDRALRATYLLQADELLEHGRISPHQGASGPTAPFTEANRLVLVLDSAGLLLQTNLSPARTSPLDTSTFRAARSGDLAFSDELVEGRGARAVYGPVLQGTLPPAAVIAVIADREGLDRAAGRFLGGALATILAAGLATLVGAWMLARSALAPVAQIAAQAELMGEPAPTRRITVHADVQELRGLVRVLYGMLERLDRYCDWHRHIIRDRPR